MIYKVTPNPNNSVIAKEVKNKEVWDQLVWEKLIMQLFFVAVKQQNKVSIEQPSKNIKVNN